MLMLAPNDGLPPVEAPMPRCTCIFSAMPPRLGMLYQNTDWLSGSFSVMPLMLTLMRVASTPRMRIAVAPTVPFSPEATTEGNVSSMKGMLMLERASSSSSRPTVLVVSGVLLSTRTSLTITSSRRRTVSLFCAWAPIPKNVMIAAMQAILCMEPKRVARCR